MRNIVLLGARLVLGSYMGFHASQKLFGKFHGPGMDAIGQVFEKNGLVPGRQMAQAATATEIIGGALTITGIAYPAGPLAVAGAMTVAAGHNRSGGLMAIRNGVELPLAWGTLALTLAAAGPGKYKIGPTLPKALTAIGVVGGAVAAGALIAKMVTSEPVLPEAADAPAAPAAEADEVEPAAEAEVVEPAAEAEVVEPAAPAVEPDPESAAAAKHARKPRSAAKPKPAAESEPPQD
jgi:putative oxidoreductase